MKRKFAVEVTETYVVEIDDSLADNPDDKDELECLAIEEYEENGGECETSPQYGNVYEL